MENRLCYGEYLRMLRKSRNLTISQLSKAIGISSQYLSEMERGGRKCLNDEKAAALSQVLSLSAEENKELSELAEETRRRVPIPADVKAFIESNPYIVDEIRYVMERKERYRAS